MATRGKIFHNLLYQSNCACLFKAFFYTLIQIFGHVLMVNSRCYIKDFYYCVLSSHFILMPCQISHTLSKVKQNSFNDLRLSRDCYTAPQPSYCIISINSTLLHKTKGNLALFRDYRCYRSPMTF